MPPFPGNQNPWENGFWTNFDPFVGSGVDHTNQPNSNSNSNSDWPPSAFGQGFPGFLFGHGYGHGPGHHPRHGHSHGHPFGHRGGRGGWGRGGGPCRGPLHHPRGRPGRNPPPGERQPSPGPGPAPGPENPRHHHSPPPPPPHPPHPPHHHNTFPPPPYEDDHPLAQVINSVAGLFFPQETASRNTGPENSNNTQRGDNAENQAQAQAQNQDQDQDPAPFRPPLDLFATPGAYVIHVALPGAKKQDVGVHWDADRGTLRVAGVLYRPGDEALLATLVPSSAERRVGFFERVVSLPPPLEGGVLGGGQQGPRRPRVGVHVSSDGDSEKDGEGGVATPETETWMDDSDEGEGKEEIDGDGITAKMEDGVLIVTVPRVERGWTDVRKVDVE